MPRTRANDRANLKPLQAGLQAPNSEIRKGYDANSGPYQPSSAEPVDE